MDIVISIANHSHFIHAETICNMMEEAAKVRGTGIAKRQPAYICKKMEEGKAIIALDKDKVVGFCYIESWSNQQYVANSGLITDPDYRNIGLAKAIKQATFNLSKQHYPKAKLFGITTSLAVMKINSELGYKPVTFSELTEDDDFWKGCQSCTNYDILQRTQRKMCMCTGMLCDLSKVQEIKTDKANSWEKFKQFAQQRKVRVKQLSKSIPELFKLINTQNNEK